jgi:glyoxylase-like metal-dependent hydrolase (beta-lactamase superfamily II)
MEAKVALPHGRVEGVADRQAGWTGPGYTSCEMSLRSEVLVKSKQDFLAGLAALRVRPEDVTLVMCTHLHWDHVGWNMRLVDGRWPSARSRLTRWNKSWPPDWARGR